MKDEKMLVVAAHIGDYLWRCGGSIAKYVAEGTEVKVIILSDGLRGEANDYWKREDATMEGAKEVRRSECLRAAEILGVKDIELWGLRDYPMELGAEEVEKLAHIYRTFRPNFIVTHDAYDAFNPDHNLVSATVRQAYAVASGAGFRDGGPVCSRQTPIFGFEPHMTEICSFQPMVYVDITDVFEKKVEAMKVFSSQTHMLAAYTRKAEIRGSEAKNRGSRANCKYAEAFSVFQPIASTGRFVW